MALGTARSNGRRRVPGGFTLIELLVVIAVIMILVSLVNPAVQRALILAGRANCSSNLHQWGIALMQYENDHNRLLPPRYPNTAYLQVFYGQSSPRYYISEVLQQRYNISRKTWYCPVDEVWDDDYYWDPNNHKSYGSCTSYIYMGDKPDPRRTYLEGAVQFRKRSSIGAPASTTVLMADMVRFYANAPNVVSHCDGYTADGLYGYAAYGIRGGNVLMADGHGEWHAWSDMKLRVIAPYSSGVLQFYW